MIRTNREHVKTGFLQASLSPQFGPAGPALTFSRPGQDLTTEPAQQTRLPIPDHPSDRAPHPRYYTRYSGRTLAMTRHDFSHCQSDARTARDRQAPNADSSRTRKRGRLAGTGRAYAPRHDAYPRPPFALSAVRQKHPDARLQRCRLRPPSDRARLRTPPPNPVVLCRLRSLPDHPTRSNCRALLASVVMGPHHRRLPFFDHPGAERSVLAAHDANLA